MGLKMNITKTKVMVVDNTPINVNNVLIENVQGYVYLGQHYSLKEKNQDKEIQRRIMAGWAAYAKHRDIFKSNLAICLKRQVYNSCVLPAMTYGAETWTLTKQAQNKLAAAQTKMERSMLNITYKDRKTNIWVRERTTVIDIIHTVRKMKWSWAGHINRLKDDRWTSAHVNNDNEACQTTDWSNATANCKHAYAAESNRLLGGVCIPDALLCKHTNCTNRDHIAPIDDFYQSINRSLIASSADTIRSRHYTCRKRHKAVPGWNDTVKHAHGVARNSYII